MFLILFWEYCYGETHEAAGASIAVDSGPSLITERVASRLTGGDMLHQLFFPNIIFWQRGFIFDPSSFHFIYEKIHLSVVYAHIPPCSRGRETRTVETTWQSQAEPLSLGEKQICKQKRYFSEEQINQSFRSILKFRMLHCLFAVVKRGLRQSEARVGPGTRPPLHTGKIEGGHFRSSLSRGPQTR